jgi:hypothetical protein
VGKSQAQHGETISHPSFGVININRASIGGGHKRLFDSPFKHYHVVTLEISPGQMTRNLHGDSIMPSGRVPYISIAMSEVQFSELILNAGRAAGTPCTIEYVNGERVEDPPPANIKKLWANEVKAGFKDIADAADAAEKSVNELLAKDRITKGDVKALKDIIYILAQDLRSNMPWMQERFQEAMEKTVADAKGEVNAHITAIIKQTGLKALQGGALPALEFSEEEGPEKK